jgi:predicted O-methyltransferase YrrM
MTMGGTAMYDRFALSHHVPALVLEAVALAKRLEFDLTVHPATGRLLASLAGGITDGLIGETGTGTGAGVAWMLSAASAGTRIVSIELDDDRARAAADLFRGQPNVRILHGEANALADHGPFDLLVLDAPSTPGPLDRAALDPGRHLRPNGLLVKDDLWPMTSWPPRAFDGSDDLVRMRWFEHPEMLTTEVVVAEGFAVQIARRRPSR